MTAEITPGHHETVIYHYCDANALLSILEKRKLWYTHAAYLNDTMEIKKGVDFCKNLLSKQLGDAPGDPVLEATNSYLANAEKWQYYICCLSARRDKLSQWRAYANDGDGFAIGFWTHYLSQSSDGPFECRLEEICYDESTLMNGFEAIVSDYRSQLAELPDTIEEDKLQLYHEHAAAHIGNWIIDQSAFHKDAGAVGLVASDFIGFQTVWLVD